MFSDDTKVIDYMRVGHRVTQFDIDSLQRIKTALAEGQKPSTNMKYSCESCTIPDKVCDRHHDCISDVWYAALKSVASEFKEDDRLTSRYISPTKRFNAGKPANRIVGTDYRF